MPATLRSATALTPLKTPASKRQRSLLDTSICSKTDTSIENGILAIQCNEAKDTLLDILNYHYGNEEDPRNGSRQNEDDE